MWMGLLLLILSCRNEDKEPVDTGTQPLTVIGDVDAMAEAWCAVLVCRAGFDDAFASVDACVDLYSNYWGNPNQLNNVRECFDDVDEVETCTTDLEATGCGGATPESCRALIDCQVPAEDTGQ
jgi:hypothetical protein